MCSSQSFPNVFLYIRILHLNVKIIKKDNMTSVGSYLLTISINQQMKFLNILVFKFIFYYICMSTYGCIFCNNNFCSIISWSCCIEGCTGFYTAVEHSLTLRHSGNLRCMLVSKKQCEMQYTLDCILIMNLVLMELDFTFLKTRRI